MIPQSVIDDLKLVLADPIGPSGTNHLRVFRWPEFSRYNALIMECSMRGDRLPKKNNLVICISNENEFRGFIMTNEMLLENMENVRKVIGNAAEALPA